MKGEYCPGWLGWVTFIVGILYLLTDLTVINFWDISWWSVMFILLGMSGIMMGKK